MTEQEIEQALIDKLADLKYTYRPNIRDRAALEHNFREKFEALNRVHLTDTEFARLLDSIVTPPPLPRGGEGWGEGGPTACSGDPSPPTPLPKGEGG